MTNSSNPLNSRYGHRCYIFEMSGRVCYDPHNGRQSKHEDYWCVINVNREITRYYREQFRRKFGILLYAPAFDAHISVLRGMKHSTPKMDENWEYLNNKDVEIYYDSDLYWNNNHVWINTYCKEYFNIREYYGVADWNVSNFSHLTIGKFLP